MGTFVYSYRNIMALFDACSMNESSKEEKGASVEGVTVVCRTDFMYIATGFRTWTV
jgi:hypothetical protein